MTNVVASEPLLTPPTWALLQRELLELLDDAWRAFERTFCTPDGRLRFTGELASRDGVDDFYEAFANWPLLYLLGGSDDLLRAAEWHWNAVTEQLTGLSMLQDEFDKGYDWFHLGEGLLVFYQLCMCEPRRFAARARRFAQLYVDPAHGNYDAQLRMIRAPHNGALGARFGLNDDGAPYPWRHELAAQYGYPLDWRHDPSAADPPVSDDPRLGTLMHERLGRGDVAINLASVALVANAYLIDGDAAWSSWCRDYVAVWAERAAANDAEPGLVPDNVGPDGKVGSLLDGRWYGGHYGWSWPHGAYSVGQAVLVGALAAATVTEDRSGLDVVRALLDTLIRHGRTGAVADSDTSLRARWLAHLGTDARTPTFLVPYRVSDRGWFDFNPVQAALPVALWHETSDAVDRERIDALRGRAGYPWSTVRSFRDKEEAGHEEPWYAYLAGDNDAYPEQILRVAIEQARRRLHLIAEVSDPVVDESGIHRWQRLNPVVTEALVHLQWGAPQALYNGGLPQARVRYYDRGARRWGLPPDVAALVSSVDPERTVVELVNLGHARRSVRIQAGAFGQDALSAVSWTGAADWGGDESDYAFAAPARMHRTAVDLDEPWLDVDLPPATRITLTLRIARNVRRPQYDPPWLEGPETCEDLDDR